MGEIRLIVQADDFGMCHAVNAGVLEAFRRGLVTQAMLMAPCPWYPEAAALAKQHGIPVGIHSTLTSEWDAMRWRPLTGAASLSEADGTFHRSIQAAAAAVDPAEASRELFAQARRVGDAGLTPISVDVHMGMVCERATFELCRQLRLPFLYPVFEPCLQLDSFEVLSPRPSATKRTWLLEHLESLGPGTHFLQTHPGTSGPELAGLAHPDSPIAAWAEAYRVSDLAVLTDPQVLRLVAARGIRPVSVTEL